MQPQLDDGIVLIIQKNLQPCDLNEWSDLKVVDLLLSTVADSKVPLVKLMIFFSSFFFLLLFIYLLLFFNLLGRG